jgi:spore germination protein PC
MDYYNIDIMQQFQQLYWYLNSQNERICQLETTIHQLQTEINSLKENQTSNIEKIEYKFDQLKVERLEGTLNIGITPHNGGGSIEDFSINQQGLHVPPVNQQDSEGFENIQRQIYEYLNGDCYHEFSSIEHQNNYSLDNQYRQHIIEDIRKQIDNRIRHYLSQINMNNLSQDDLERVNEMTINKVKEDIHKTYDEFLKHLPRKENE